MKLVRCLLAIAIASSASIAFPAENLYVDADTVRAVQKTLRDRGFRVGVDGIMGARTQAALRQFQKAENLDPTGRLNRQTLVALGVQEAASAGASEQPSYGAEILRKAQATLNARGYKAGPVNGRMNAQLGQALREFQKSENLEVTGRLNPGTLAALGMDTTASAGR